jgi:UDP-N-acetylglucosamine 1-carboxyvinyltransferase
VSDKLLIDGGQPLSGEVFISGAKNSVLKLMAAALLSPHPLHLSNVPNLSDVAVMSQVLEALGRTVQRPESGLLTIEAGEATCWKAPYELVSKMRASFNVLGALLSRYGYARVPLPGGCSIGKRGVDQHVKGFVALGAEVTMDHGFVEVKGEQLKGANIVLDMPSVGATENILLASIFAEGTTILSNAAQEPEIADLANCLNAMGAEILGAGTSEITIHGVLRTAMREASYEVMPDRIEAATYMAAIVGTRGDALVHRVRPEHLSAVLSKLEGMGARLEMIAPTTMRVQGPPQGEAFKPVSLLTTFYPGFPTDLQAPLMTLLATAEGTSMVSETIYENRFMHVGELKRMGAHIEVQGDVAVITGVAKLMGAPVKAYDLRAGAALVIAALMAEGYTSLYNLYHLDRGYDQLVEKLQGLKASIRRLPLEESESKQVAEIL